MEESAEVKRARDAALRENRRLQEDLATLTRENQAINGELNEALEEREAYKQQVFHNDNIVMFILLLLLLLLLLTKL